MTSLARAVGLLGLLLSLTGCDDGTRAGEVTGTITVDNQVPAEGSSITFSPVDGKTSGGGGLITHGKYSTKVPVGTYKVEIRVPRPARAANARKEGPGPGASDVEESLPEKYNEKTELTLEVKPGKNERNWDLQTK